MTELSFLIDLLLNHKLPKPTREAVAARIRDVEKQSVFIPPGVVPRPIVQMAVPSAPLPPQLANQSPSTQAALARHPDLVAQIAGGPVQQDVSAGNMPAPPPPAQPVTQIAQTPAAAQALAARQQAINEGVAGIPNKGGPKSPRKW